MKNEYRTAQGLEINDRHVKGLAIVFNSRSQILETRINGRSIRFREVISPDAVSLELLDESNVLCLLDHDTKRVLARSLNGSGSLTLTRTDNGVEYEFDAPTQDFGLVEYLTRGDITGSSFLFGITSEDEVWTKDEDGVALRTITNIRYIGDVSPVFNPAYLGTDCELSARSIEMYDEIMRSCEEETTEETPVEETETGTETHEEGNTDNDITEENTTEEERNNEEVETNEETTETEETNESSNEENKDNKNIVRTIMKKNFSLVSAIRSIADGKALNDTEMAVVSRGKKMFANGGLESVGQIVIPTGEARAEVTLASEEGDVVEVAIADILQPLYDTTNPLIAAGAQYWSGLNTEVKIPYINKGLVTWEGETAAAGDAGVAFGSTTYAPKRLTAYVDISKALLSVDSVGVENAIITMLGNAIQDKVVATILGTDDSNGNTRPEGLGYGKSFDNLADFKAFCKKEAELQKNGFNDLTYILSPSAKAFARTLTMNKGTRNVMEGNDFDGTKTITTYNVPDGKLYVGSFKDLVICTFGAVDLVVDNISQATNGKVRIVINFFCDAKMQRPNSIETGSVSI